ncbi:unnamed protein product [Miscanthus lutarioriparius]|uniref:Aldehyde dehydrogenase domain-containing protein n=1 Tax=Miscanthus lutarioriparius TaxID=422564 RepID=A0A811NDQ6_9POAL|nr:unnamed protein product [Miscanthus lutarioriparius]
MAFWWPLLVLAAAYALCRLLLLLIPPTVPSIDVDASDVLAKEDSFIYNVSSILTLSTAAETRKGKAAQTDKVQCYEPATMKYLGQFPALTPDEVNEHVAQARKAQKIWAKSSFKQRRQFLQILLKYILEHQDLICEVSSRDTGKTMVDASLCEIMTTCEKITWLLDEGEKWLKPEYSLESSKLFLHDGKVSEYASWSGCFYFRIIQAALSAVGAPENLVHIITGFAETGQALVSSVDKIIFVGSPGVGKMIMKRTSETLIPVTLELGGKDSFIVCEDVDLPSVVQVAVRAALQSSGQNCAGAERFYVHNDIYSAFVSQVVMIVKSICVGPPLSGRYDMGAIYKGAKIAVRGSFGNLSEDSVDQFFPPTVLVNVDHTMKIMQEEAFGPILPIMKFSSDEEAIKLANDSKYGLGCAVFSGNQKRAIRIASQIHCGVAAINDFASSYMCQSLPFGGVKDSGFGRFAGVEGLRACCLVKSVVEDRLWPYIKTVIPKPIQYPVSEHGFEFQQLLVETLYGYSVWDRLRSLVNLIKMVTEQNSAPASNAKTKKRR